MLGLQLVAPLQEVLETLEARDYLKEIGHWECVLARIISLAFYYLCASCDVNCLSCMPSLPWWDRPSETLS